MNRRRSTKHSRHRSLISFAICTFGVISFARANAEDTCLSWFKESGISTLAKDCIIHCDIYPKDMGTFDCAERCDEFCKPNKCLDDSYWRQKFREGRPKDWEIISEISSVWTESEKIKMMELLNRFPDRFKSVPFDGFYRMKKSVTMTNPSTTSSSGKAIAVYDRAFGNPFLSTSRLLVHEFGHVIFQSLSASERRDYSKTMKWKKEADGTESRPGDFVSSRAQDNAIEDFAENLNFMIFEPEVLKTKASKAFEWLRKKFPSATKLKEDCRHEKN